LLSDCDQISSLGVEIASDLPTDTITYDDLGTPDFEVVTYGVYSVNSSGLSLCSYSTRELAPTLLSAPGDLTSMIYDLTADNAPTSLGTGDATLGEDAKPLNIEARPVFDEATASTFYWMQVNGKYIAPLFKDENKARWAQINGTFADPVRYSFAVPNQVPYETYYKPADVGGTDLGYEEWDSEVWRTSHFRGKANIEWTSEYAESYLSQTILDEAKEAPTGLQVYKDINPLDLDYSVPGIYDASPFPKDLLSEQVPDDQLNNLLWNDVTFNRTYYRFTSDTISDHNGTIMPNLSNYEFQNQLFTGNSGFGRHATWYTDANHTFVWVKWIAKSNRDWEQGKVYLREIKNGAFYYWPHDSCGQNHNYLQQSGDFEMRKRTNEPSNYKLGGRDVQLSGHEKWLDWDTGYEEGKYNKVLPPDPDDSQKTLSINDWGVNWVVCKENGMEDLGNLVYSGWYTQDTVETQEMRDSRIPYLTDYSNGANPEFHVGTHTRPSYGPWRDRLGVYTIYACGGGTCRTSLWNPDHIYQFSFSQSAFNAPSALTAGIQGAGPVYTVHSGTVEVGMLVEILREPDQAGNAHMTPSKNYWTVTSVDGAGNVNVEASDGTAAFLSTNWRDDFWQALAPA